MPLAAGTRCGRFEMVAPLGAGGMGEVYRARDPDLGREVALKVLPEDLRRDPDRLTRFEREARAIAALNHPNILVVFEVGVADGSPFVVTELLEGETLREALSPRLTLRQALDYAAQIAHGLAAAHEKGVIHRDLKPENLFVTRDGRVKILDFGLARMTSPPEGMESNVETLSAVTTPGTVLGSTGYMAPEQVRGQKVDARADIFALGVVLHEMLAGRPVFRRGTTPETLTAILNEEPPDVHQLVPEVSTGVAHVVRRCLEKRAEDRFQSARDVAFALEVGVGANGSSPLTASRTKPTLVLATVAAMGGLLVGLALARVGQRPAATAPLTRLTLETPASARLSDDVYVPFALSPDGTTLAYTTSQPEKLYLRRLDGYEIRALAGTDGAYDPFFSPDGQWVGYWAAGTIKKVPVAGGPPVELCRASDMLGASWGDDGHIVFALAEEGGLRVVPSQGGEPRDLTTLDASRHELLHTFPQTLPGGRAVLFTAMAKTKGDPYSVEVLDRTTGRKHTVVAGARYGRFVPSGHLIFVRGTTLFAMAFDPQTLQSRGSAVAVLEDMVLGFGEALVSTSNEGTLAYVPEAPSADHTLVWVDRSGSTAPLDVPARLYQRPRFSPDGRRLALSVSEPGRQDIWIYDLRREILERFTFDRTASLGFYAHTFTPDSRHLTYTVDAPGGYAVVTQTLDGSAPVQELFGWSRRLGVQSWHPDGQTLLMGELGTTTGGDTLVYRAGAEPKVAPFDPKPGNQWGARFSPDGRQFAYSGDESGQFEVYVQPYPGPGSKRQITTDGGREPVWSGDGRELFYWNRDRLMAVPILATSPFEAGKPRLLFEGRFVRGSPGLPSYDVSPDGRRFIMMKADRDQPARELRIVLHWFDELKRLARAP